MEIRQVWAVYFSPTGTTKKVVSAMAEALGAELGCTVQHRDFTVVQNRQEPMSFAPDDLVVFGVPVYAGRVPNILLPYLNTLQGNDAVAIPVVVFGNRSYDEALKELRNLLLAQGFYTVAAGAFVGEHSFSRVLARGRPDKADMELVRSFADCVKEKLRMSDDIQPVTLRDEGPVRPYYQPLDEEGAHIDIRKVRPKVNSDCNNCGLCVRLCPMGAIEPKDVRRYINICIKCGACIKGCPKGARYYDDPGYLYHKLDLEQTYFRRAEPEWFL